ncbi:MULTISPECIES: omptin family outer membrane protease [unclassified Methylobacterium]|jgi:opacity protein-like surface antigen/outer membrane protease|uniref:omptin family outer membrane protease n=1 Tax=unclassified Methylobacterium TaxID=2615210 RepID=UPI001353D44F|nr:omptin family outer membrane protease [Methylobacterium sp. 2A]MWV25798.1 outer membrane beta-barrel protein [Methylobacterium sp. 2A]
MQRTVGSGLLLVLLSQTALAADLPRPSRSDPVLPPPFTWSGAYGGLFAGYGALGSDTRFVCVDQAGRPGDACPVLPSRKASDGSFIAGGEVGYNWQAPFGLVAGAAADYQFTRLWGYGRQQGDVSTVNGFTFPNSVANSGQRLDDLATFRGKLGFALDRTFVYATAGLAVGNVRIDNNLSLSLGGDQRPTLSVFDGRGGAVRLGYVAGAGIEHALSEHLSAKVEGLYYDLGSRAVVPEQASGILPGYRAGTRVATDGFLARAGLNYRFGAGLPDVPAAGAAGRSGSAATWAFEGGLRYFYSSGSPRETLNDNHRPGQANSRLIYGGAQAHAGESFARLEHNPTGLFVKGFLGAGGVTDGRLSDEDFPPALNPYSRTISTIKDGDISYGAVDFGYNLLRRDGFKLGGFFGYQFFSELYNGYGCRQVAENDGCVPSYPANLKGLGENMQWNALRVGLIGEARFDRVRLSLEGAYLPVVAVDGVDRHWLRSAINPGAEGGRGDGYVLEGIIAYDLTPSVSVGVGGRYWRMQADKAQTTFPLSSPSPIRFETQRYGGFVQLSYRLADFGLGGADPVTALVRKD